MFLAASPSTTTTDSVSRYFDSGLSNVIAQDRHLLRADDAGRAVVREPAELGQRPDHEELRGERGHREIEALDAQTRQSEYDADEGGAHAGQHEGDENRHPRHAQHEVVRGERADRHERRRAERELARVAGQDVEPHRRQREDQERDQDPGQPVLIREERHDDESDDEQRGDRDPVLADRKDLLVLGVRGLELSGFAVQHQSRSEDSRTPGMRSIVLPRRRHAARVEESAGQRRGFVALSNSVLCLLSSVSTKRDRLFLAEQPFGANEQEQQARARTGTSPRCRRRRKARDRPPRAFRRRR